MLSRSIRNARNRVQLSGMGVCSASCGRKVLSIMLLSIAFFFAFIDHGARSWAAENGKCGEALKVIAAEGFQEQSIRSRGSGVCTPDILSYVGFVGFVLSSGNEPTRQQLEVNLLKSAESGYLSAEILYTLLFTNGSDSRFSSDFFAQKSYSRYVPYITSLRLFGEWRQNRIVDKFFLASQFANEAVHQGIIEAYLLRHFFNYIEFKRGNDEASRKDAAISLLILANFLNENETARQHLVQFLALDKVELDSLEAVSRDAVAHIIDDPENSVCRGDKECVLSLNLKRVICDIRDRSGRQLHRVDEENCTHLSEPLIRLYRQAVESAFDSFISEMKR